MTLLQLRGIGRKTIHRHFLLSEDMDGEYETVCSVLAETGRLQPRFQRYSEQEIRQAAARAAKLAGTCGERQIEVVDCLSRHFPKRLFGTDDPPAVLYCRGNIRALNADKSVAVVGTRNPSPAGFAAGRNISRTVSEKGYVVVSGLAVGCDTAAHRGCLDAAGDGGCTDAVGQTVAVLPSSPDNVYPLQNRELAEEIISRGGCLVSEYPPGTQLSRGLFADRDRLQSGLSDGVIVIEAGGGETIPPDGPARVGGSIYAVNACLSSGKPLGVSCHEAGAGGLSAGNRWLLEHCGAFAIRHEDDLNSFEEAMGKIRRKNNKHEASGQDDNRDSYGQGRWEQMSLEEMGWHL